jgi:hypothetical protein
MAAGSSGGPRATGRVRVIACAPMLMPAGLSMAPGVWPCSAATVAGADPRRSANAGTFVSQPFGQPASSHTFSPGMPCVAAQRVYERHTTLGGWQMPLCMPRMWARIRPSMVKQAS